MDGSSSKNEKLDFDTSYSYFDPSTIMFSKHTLKVIEVIE